MSQQGLKTFELLVEVNESDLDEMQHVNNVRYLQWVQDVAKAHWKSLTNQNLQNKFAWVVVSHLIHYKIPAILGDKILIRTYIKESSGVTSVRVVEMYLAGSQQKLVEAETKWCLLNRKNLKPARIPDEIIRLFQD